MISNKSRKEVKNIKSDKGKRKLSYICISIVALVLIFTTLITANENINVKTILQINNEEVTVNEFMLNYNLDKQNTVDVIIENKAFLNILKEYGIIESTSYDMFLSKLKNENERRLKAKEKNEIIYGPIQYTDKQYYEYILSDGRAELEFILEDKFRDQINSRIQVSYEDNIEKYKIEDAVEVEIFSVNFIDENGFVNEINKEEAKKTADQIRREISAGTYKLNENVCVEKREFKYSNKAYDENYYAEIKEMALSLNVGDVSKVIEFNGGYHILKCLNRYDQGYEELDIVKDQIFVREIDLIIDELVEKEKANMEVIINEEVFNEIK